MSDADSGNIEEPVDSVTGMFSRRTDEAVNNAIAAEEAGTDLGDETSSRLGGFVRDGVKRVRAAREQFKNQITQARECTTAYVREEPVKALLIAAAAGALLAGTITLLGRSRASHRL
ncbi:MAG TPA: hypothetical protein VLC92_15955 [Rhodocyclaceae bacterium]|nr:hypothetical protein [Rhodocyclaceae bacterium]